LFRFLGAPSKCEFLKDGMNIVDVLAILPYFISTIVLGLREAAARKYRILSIDGAAGARDTEFFVGFYFCPPSRKIHQASIYLPHKVLEYCKI
jgi:hypothetical protein